MLIVFLQCFQVKPGFDFLTFVKSDKKPVENGAEEDFKLPGKPLMGFVKIIAQDEVNIHYNGVRLFI